MGVVYLARQPSLDRLVALKVLRSGPWINEELIARFTREAKAAALTHPHIVPVYDYGEWDEGFFISMGYMPGGSLADAIERDGRIPPAQVAKVGTQIASALTYAHGKGVVHRDVKPSNVLMDEEGNAFLGDFGIAHMASATSLTGTTQWIGTPSYMAPELAQGQKASPASDVYALGATLYECVTGTPLYSGEDPHLVLYQHRFEPVPDLPQDVPAEVGLPILRALEKDPAARYPTAEAFGRALRGEGPSKVGYTPTVLVGEPSEAGPISPIPGTIPEAPSTQPTSEPERPARRRGLLVGAIAAALLLLAGVVGALALSGGDGGEPPPAEEPPAVLPEGDFSPPDVSVDPATSPTELLVRWTIPQDVELFQFQLIVNGEPLDETLPPDRTQLLVPDLTPDTRFCFRVRAISVNEQQQVSAASCETTLADLQVPGEVGAALDGDRIVLTWVDTSLGEDRFQILIDDDADDPVMLIADEQEGDLERKEIKGLGAGEHCFRIRAIANGQGESALSPEACETIPARAVASPAPGDGKDTGGQPTGTQSPPPPTPPPAPSVSVVDSGDGFHVTVSWTVPAGADEVCFTASSPGVEGECFSSSNSRSVTLQQPGTKFTWCAASRTGSLESGARCDSHTTP
jgi:serine/threonine-protein kinase